jgi:hypothetical protein
MGVNRRALSRKDGSKAGERNTKGVKKKKRERERERERKPRDRRKMP